MKTSAARAGWYQVGVAMRSANSRRSAASASKARRASAADGSSDGVDDDTPELFSIPEN
jgi:hypothetical protein